MDATLESLDEFVEGGVGGWGGVDGVGGQPEVGLAVVDHLPYAGEELVAVYNKLC